MNSTHWPLAGVAALLLTMQAQAADGQTIYAQGVPTQPPWPAPPAMAPMRWEWQRRAFRDLPE